MKPADNLPDPDVSLPRQAISPMGGFRYSAIALLLALVFLFVATPFVEDLPRGDLLESALVSLVMLFAVLAVGGRHRTLIAALLLGSPALVAKWANHLRPDLAPPELVLVMGTVFFVFVIFHILRFILRAPQVDANVLCAGLSGYLMLGLLWVPAYLLVAEAAPASHPAFALSTSPDAGHTLERYNAFYFSFVTLCTVGYGDVAPVSKVARMLAVMEAITGLFYVTVLMSRLVAVHSATQRTVQAPRPPTQT